MCTSTSVGVHICVHIHAMFTQTSYTFWSLNQPTVMLRVRNVRLWCKQWLSTWCWPFHLTLLYISFYTYKTGLSLLPQSGIQKKCYLHYDPWWWSTGPGIGQILSWWKLDSTAKIVCWKCPGRKCKAQGICGFCFCDLFGKRVSFLPFQLSGAYHVSTARTSGEEKLSAVISTIAWSVVTFDIWLMLKHHPLLKGMSLWWNIKMVNTCSERNISGVKCIMCVIKLQRWGTAWS